MNNFTNTTEKQVKVMMDYQMERVNKMNYIFRIIGFIAILAGVVLYVMIDNWYYSMLVFVFAIFVISSGYLSRWAFIRAMKRHEEMMKRVREVGE